MAHRINPARHGCTTIRDHQEMPRRLRRLQVHLVVIAHGAHVEGTRCRTVPNHGCVESIQQHRVGYRGLGTTENERRGSRGCNKDPVCSRAERRGRHWPKRRETARSAQRLATAVRREVVGPLPGGPNSTSPVVVAVVSMKLTFVSNTHVLRGQAIAPPMSAQHRAIVTFSSTMWAIPASSPWALSIAPRDASCI